MDSIIVTTIYVSLRKNWSVQVPELPSSVKTRTRSRLAINAFSILEAGIETAIPATSLRGYYATSMEPS